MIENLKEIKSSPITGKETLNELLDKSFTGHLSRGIRDIIKHWRVEYTPSFENTDELAGLLTYLKFGPLEDIRYPFEEMLIASSLLKKWIKENYTIFLAFAGALTPADFGTSCLTPLIERGIIDAITTTGANIYHEIQRAIGGKFYEFDLKTESSHVLKGDIILRKEEYSRIYNIIFDSGDLVKADETITEIFNSSYIKDKLPFADFIRTVGLILEEKIGCENWITLARNYNIPIFCGAPHDSGLGFDLAFNELMEMSNFDFDIVKDMNIMAAFQYLAQKEGKIAIIILGGGTPKNFTLQANPLLTERYRLPDTRGFDGDFQISMARVEDGGLSSCPASEGHTWGKVSGDGIISSVYIEGEILSIFPLLVYEICRKDLRKKHKDLFLRKDAALDDLRRAVRSLKKIYF